MVDVLTNIVDLEVHQITTTVSQGRKYVITSQSSVRPANVL